MCGYSNSEYTFTKAEQLESPTLAIKMPTDTRFASFWPLYGKPSGKKSQSEGLLFFSALSREFTKQIKKRLWAPPRDTPAFRNMVYANCE